MKYYFSFLLLIILVSCQTQSDSKEKVNTIPQKEEIQNKPIADNKDGVLNILEEDTNFLTVNGDKVQEKIINQLAPCDYFTQEEKKTLKLFLSDDEICELSSAYIKLQITSSDWDVLQSYFQIQTIAKKINTELFYKKEWWVEGEKEMANEMLFENYIIMKLELIQSFLSGFYYLSYDCGSFYGGNFSISAFKTKLTETEGNADNSFFSLVDAIGTHAYGNKFKVYEGIGSTPYSNLGSGSFLNYFTNKAEFDKYQVESDTFSMLKNKDIEYLKNMLRIHNRVINLMHSLPSNKLHFSYSLDDCLKELKDILNANVLTEQEQQDLKNHVLVFEEYMKKSENSKK